ncbi:MAG: hypothetical protein JW774_02435 [Candidatus Aureabacteria bacterium]|nr:hypothetical protein [Candidatus Auribacterota bacterium]
MFIKYILDLWNTDLVVSGQTMMVLMIFNIIFMLMGRFRFCFASTLGMIFYWMFFENRKILDAAFSMHAATAMFVAGGALFLSLIIWAFFIDSE